MQGALPGSEVIRRASKATVLLQAFAGVLLIGLAIMFGVIANRYSSLQDGIRENALWSLYQLDREARKLHESVHVAAIEGLGSAEALSRTSQRYDILYSRMSILEEGNFDRRFGGERDTGPMIAEIDRTIRELEPAFDAINDEGTVTAQTLRRIDTLLEPLISRTEALLIYANNAVSADRADARAGLLSLQIKSAGLVALLVASVGCLVFLLRRQLRNVRAAGFSLEFMAQELKKACLAAEAGNRAKSQFMATIGHEIRTPLNAILGTAELLQLSALPKGVGDGVANIRRSGQALLEIINEILDYARMEQGKLTVAAQPMVVEDTVRPALDMLRDRAAENRNEIRLALPEKSRLPVILSDPTRVRQVVLNLLSNAIKFTADGIITLRLSEIRRDDADRLRIEVSDTGIGIDEEGLGKLFQPFSQVDATIGRRFGGTGLGLAICKEIVESLGGVIGVRSLKGHGSVFWFELPAVAAEAPLAEAPEEPAALPRRRILLVEDNRVNQEVAAGFLRHLGQTVAVAGDGLEAVRQAEAADFDLVLMDMQMPNLDGVAATGLIRQIAGPRGRVPIIAMTANASEDDRRRCEEAGMNGFQSKPVSMAKLREAIATHAAPPATSAERRDFDRRRGEIVEALGEEGFAELLDSFFDDACALLKDLHASLAGNDGNRDRLLHTLKGAAASIGFRELAAACQEARDRQLTPADIRDLETTINACKSRSTA